MAEDEPMDVGVEYDEGEWADEEFATDALQEEEAASDVKPELKRLYQQHPECNLDYMEHVLPRLTMEMLPPKDDKNHRTYPFLTTFERTKIIGLRANQLSKGAAPLIHIPEHITDVRDIARLELEQKRLPFIVKRPLPNGSFEYWRLSDLLIL